MEETTQPVEEAELLGTAMGCFLEMPCRIATSYFFKEALKNRDKFGDIFYFLEHYAGQRKIICA